jgi:ubiquinone/menaquinone biosynthesis C-methylase UbiE
MDYQKHFGEQSFAYRQFRPDYPDELYQYLNEITDKHELAWDCGTGNGQSAVKLADYFTQVIASDLNQAQLDVAIKRSNVRYYCWPAEKTELSDHTVDLITVAQALHWFHLDAFYQEVERVMAPSGVIAAWCYSLGKINHHIDSVINKLYAEILGDQYWPSERRYIDAEYKTMPFPFKRIHPPQAFSIAKEMNLAMLIGYLTTWSALKEYQKINQANPLDLIYPELEKVWGDPHKTYTMQWMLHLLIGRME